MICTRSTIFSPKISVITSRSVIQMAFIGVKTKPFFISKLLHMTSFLVVVLFFNTKNVAGQAEVRTQTLSDWKTDACCKCNFIFYLSVGLPVPGPWIQSRRGSNQTALDWKSDSYPVELRRLLEGCQSSSFRIKVSSLLIKSVRDLK